MTEKIYPFTTTQEKLIEIIVDESAVMINHVILPEGDALPIHRANSNVYMILIKGSVSLALDDGDTRAYSAGSIISIPFGTKMDVQNSGGDPLEFFIVKAPGPKSLPKI